MAIGKTIEAIFEDQPNILADFRSDHGFLRRNRTKVDAVLRALWRGHQRFWHSKEIITGSEMPLAFQAIGVFSLYCLVRHPLPEMPGSSL